VRACRRTPAGPAGTAGALEPAFEGPEEVPAPAALAPAPTGSECTGPAGTGRMGVGGCPTTVGVLVEGTLTVGTLVEGTLTVGTLVEGTLTVGTLTVGTLTPAVLGRGTLTCTLIEGTAAVVGVPGSDTAPATALTEAPSAAPQRPASSPFTVVARRLRRCAGMVSHRAVPSGPCERTPHHVNGTASSWPRLSR
jgi:hypothetical protein